MADELQGGLNAVTQPVEVPDQETPIVEETSKEALLKGSSEEKLRRQRAIYDAHLQQMIDTFKGRTANLGYDPKLLAMSRGFLTPGKTGNFFESLGTAFGGYGEAAQEEQKLKLDDMLTKEKLLGLQLGQTKEDYALEKELKGKQYLQDVISGRVGKPRMPTTGASTEKLSVRDAYSLIDEAQDPQSGTTITDAMIVAAPNKETREILEKIQDNQRKDKEIEQKEFGSTKITLPVIGEPTENITVGQAREIKKLDMATRGMPIEERTAIFNQYYQDKGILGRRAVVSPTGKTTEQFETPQQRAIRIEGEKETVKETAKANVDDIKFIEKRRDSAIDQINDAKSVYTIATNPQTKNAFGILARPGIAAAFGELVREPLKFGDISVGVSNIENIIRKAGGTQEEINAAAIVARNIAQLELGFSQAFKGQGQVSDNERLIVRNVGPQISDNPKVAALKAESIIARAEFDDALANKFSQWQESHPNGTVRQFKGTPEYKTVKVGYDNKLGNILSKYGMTPARVGTEKSTSSPKKGGSLWEAIQNAKESE
jgi:hypothetical protein